MLPCVADRVPMSRKAAFTIILALGLAALGSAALPDNDFADAVAALMHVDTER